MIYINFDLGIIQELQQSFRSEAEKALKEATRDLAMQTHAHIVEEVNSKLHSTREKFLNALSFDEVGQDTFMIHLDKSAMWIEEGLPANYDMLEGLLKSKKAKTAKDGSRYVVVPFEHKKGPTQSTAAEQDLTNTIKSEMRKRKIPYGKIEKNGDGSAKTGLLHSFDIMKAPVKSANGPGMGRGPIGAVKQGPTGIPFLQGVRVYQSKQKGKNGKEHVSRSIMTFRVASSKHKGQGRWVHPGLQAKKFLDEAAQWALKEFEAKIKNQVLISVSQRF